MSAAVSPVALPLSPDQSSLLAPLTEGLDDAGLWWLSGYAAGLDNASPPARCWNSRRVRGITMCNRPHC